MQQQPNTLHPGGLFNQIAHQKLMALTWKQPFAELMLHGKIETRTRPTKYRGWVLICAGKQAYSTAQVREISGAYQMIRMESVLAEYNPRYEGNAIAIGWLADCRPMELKDEDKCFVQYSPLRWCHVYQNVTLIKPLPWKGKQGWCRVPEEIVKQIIVL